MTITDSEILMLFDRVTREIESTISLRYRDLAPETVAEVSERFFVRFGDDDADIESLSEKMVEDVQQSFMDTFIDMSWPACPRHPNHPMWFHDGAWPCDRDGVALAQLGELSSIMPPLPPEPPFTPGSFVRRRKAT